MASSGNWSAAGLRNPFGVAFNPAGDLFTYDADAEFDMGTPWYRPTRIVQLLTGADYGWRGVTGKWPPYFADHPDNAPATLDIGRGSPTAVAFGTATALSRRIPPGAVRARLDVRPDSRRASRAARRGLPGQRRDISARPAAERDRPGGRTRRCAVRRHRRTQDAVGALSDRIHGRAASRPEAIPSRKSLRKTRGRRAVAATEPRTASRRHARANRFRLAAPRCGRSGHSPRCADRGGAAALGHVAAAGNGRTAHDGRIDGAVGGRANGKPGKLSGACRATDWYPK